MEVEELKKKYSAFGKKYKLPSFKELNDDFEIEKIERDSDTFLKVVRKQMMEKIMNLLGFIEMILNPVNAPRIYYAYLKSVGTEERNYLDRIYSKLGDISIAALELEVDYDEGKEAKMIARIFSDWREIKPDMRKVVKNMMKPNNTVQREKSYFG